MQFDGEKVRANVRAAPAEDLLDRATVWRDNLEPEALDIVEAVLRERGIRPEELEAHARRRTDEGIRYHSGAAAICYCCPNPAVERKWVWWRFLNLLPLVPLRVSVCAEHRARNWLISRSRFGRRPPA